MDHEKHGIRAIARKGIAAATSIALALSLAPAAAFADTGGSQLRATLAQASGTATASAGNQGQDDSLSLQKSLAFVPDSTLSDDFKLPKHARVGVDVSVWNQSVDWKKAKKAGVQFAILRCGYGSDYTFQDDKYFKENVDGCKAAGIPYGIYLYSYAENTNMAASEANHALRVMREAGAKPSLPVFYDLEEHFMVDEDHIGIIGDIAYTFCKRIEKAGYRAGVYAGLYWWRDNLTDKRFSKFERWVAQWNTYCGYEGDYLMWQCSSDGSVPGIGESGGESRVDMNYLLPYSDVHVNSAFSRNGWLDKAISAKMLKMPYKRTSYKLKPSAKTTRAFALTMLYRMANPKSKATTKKAAYQKNKTAFKDVKSKQYYTAAVNWAAKKGIVKNTRNSAGKLSNKVKPGSTITRQQLAVMLYRYAKKAGLKTTNVKSRTYKSAVDAKKVAKNARKAYEWCYDYKVLTGSTKSGSLKLDPKAKITRAQAIKAILKVKAVKKK